MRSMHYGFSPRRTTGFRVALRWHKFCCHISVPLQNTPVPHFLPSIELHFSPCTTSNVASAPISCFLSNNDVGLSTGCDNPPKCTPICFNALPRLLNILLTKSPTPLHMFRVTDDAVELGLVGVCPVCMLGLDNDHQARRLRYWENIPLMSDLPAWPELERMKLDALGPQAF
ncbi:hypothetical protein C8F01DRAFT_142350 [Mycena amicta]|nr:hypothetical protein C8F01DRAFT_142350 [Mycena amicta]